MCKEEGVASMGELGEFVLARLAEDERRLAEGELPYLDEAERRGRLRIIVRTTGEVSCSFPGRCRRTPLRSRFPKELNSSAARCTISGTRTH